MSSCYICLGSDSKKPFVADKGCSCKGSISFHASCFQKWVDSTNNPFQCAVCKSDYNGTFLKRFMSPEEILLAGEDEDEDEEELESYVIHGVPVLLDDELFIHFDNIYHETIYDQSLKMELKGIRRNCLRMSKKPFNRLSKNVSIHTNRKKIGFTSRKR